MAGYWSLEEETNQVLTKDGWLYTGDMGYIDENGFLVLSGRKKNLICLKGGEKFYPEVIEERITTSSYIANAMMIGEGCTRSAVIVNVSKDAVEGLPQKEIDNIVAKEIFQQVADLEYYRRPARHLILPEFTAEEGLLTPTLNIKRHEVMKKYEKEIADFLQYVEKGDVFSYSETEAEDIDKSARKE